MADMDVCRPTCSQQSLIINQAVSCPRPHAPGRFLLGLSGAGKETRTPMGCPTGT